MCVFVAYYFFNLPWLKAFSIYYKGIRIVAVILVDGLFSRKMSRLWC